MPRITTGLRSKAKPDLALSPVAVTNQALKPDQSARLSIELPSCEPNYTLCLMVPVAQIRPAYSRAERLTDGAVHVTGVLLALMAVPMLISSTVNLGASPEVIIGTSVYGTTLLVLLTCSALYHTAESDEWRSILKRLDHCAIFIKIAGTYTPFILLSGAHVSAYLVGLWGSAACGSLLKSIAPDRFRWLTLALYLTMGWTIVWAGGALLEDVPRTIVVIMLLGGVTFTVGVVFYLLDTVPFHKTIWHVFVLAGCILFFTAIAMRVGSLPLPLP